MDTTSTYTKMCEKAEEIQESRKLDDREWGAGDWGCWPDNGDINVMYMGEYEPGELGKGHIWLPRQDQLQEMVFTRGEDLTNQAIKIAEYREIDTDDGLVLFSSWEQWWLAFVMKEKYNKIWDGEEWHSEQT